MATASYEQIMTILDRVAQDFAEIAELRKETERMSLETERKFQEVAEENRARTQETERKFQEVAEAQQEVSRQLRETRRMVDGLTGQWGMFLENQVAPACEHLFNERGIPVQMVTQRTKKRCGGNTMEVDVLVVNDGHVVAVEVKATLNAEAVRHFVERLQQFRVFFPEYAHWEIYGAMAGMRIDDGADNYARRAGLFVLAQSGESIKITNDAQFQPKAW